MTEKMSPPWAECPAFYVLPAGLDAVLTACQETQQPMSATDRRALADWLRLEKARVERDTRPIDRHHVAIDRRALEAIIWGLAGSEDLSRPRIRCPWCDGDCLRWGAETCPFRPRQIPRDRRAP